MWLTVDWDPTFHGWDEDASSEANKGYDSPAELASYRKAYLNAITRASRGELAHITRNSHVCTKLYIGITNELGTGGVIHRLSKFIFGSGILGNEVERAIKGGAWYVLGQTPETIAEIAGRLQYLHLFCYLCSNANNKDSDDHETDSSEK